MDLGKNLKIDSVERLQISELLTLGPNASVREAIRCMQERPCGWLLVCEQQALVGIFTERDLVKRVLNERKSLDLPLRDCMTINPVTVQLKDSVGVALRRMQEGGYRHLPVVDGAGKPVGVLSVKKIVRYLVEHFPSTVYNQPPDPQAVQHDREGA
jgi:CBS domain-containing protein